MQNTDALRSFFTRVTPAIPELFNMAYAICGNYDLAEYVLQFTLMEAWSGDSHGGMGFREGMRNTLRRVAVEEALEPRENALEFSWDGLVEPGEDPILRLLAQESTETRRAVALRYGCGLPAAKIARLMNVSTNRVKELIDRFSRSASRSLPAEERRRFELKLAKTVDRAFDRASAEMPSLGLIYRTFETEALETRRPKHLASKLVKRTLAAVLAVVCALVFWLAAVLMQPKVMEEPPAIVTEEGQ